MRVRTPLAVGIGVLALAYVAYPCWTLYRLQSALACGDTATLNALVNWPSVRNGIEVDLARQQRDSLPMFGTGFMRQIAVKSDVNPGSVVTAVRRSDAGPQHRTGISSAWLEGPRTLVVDADGLRVRVQLGLDGWQVTRVWLSPAMLRQAVAAG